jgi:hypothetical protein
MGPRPRRDEEEPIRRNFTIPEGLDRRFRDAVERHLGQGSGNYSLAVCQGMELWIRTHEHRPRKA